MCTFMFQGLCFHHLHHQRRSFRSCKAGTVFGFQNHKVFVFGRFLADLFLLFYRESIGRGFNIWEEIKPVNYIKYSKMLEIFS